MDNTPKIVGIVNITEDSFSDGGQFLSADDAVAHARELAETGADIIELGPASSNPDAIHVPGEDQIARLAPVLEALSTIDVPISIDATDSDVLEFAAGSGVSMLNDVRGFPDPRIHPLLTDSDASLVVVHSLLERERAARNDAKPSEVLASIDRFFDARLAELVRAGVSEDRLIVDPGMGFFLGTDPEASIAVLQRIPELCERFGRPVLISVSRKSFLRTIADRNVDRIGSATLAAELYAVSQGADYVRTHDAAALRDALEITRRLNTRIP